MLRRSVKSPDHPSRIDVLFRSITIPVLRKKSVCTQRGAYFPDNDEVHSRGSRRRRDRAIPPANMFRTVQLRRAFFLILITIAVQSIQFLRLALSSQPASSAEVVIDETPVFAVRRFFCGVAVPIGRPATSDGWDRVGNVRITTHRSWFVTCEGVDGRTLEYPPSSDEGKRRWRHATYIACGCQNPTMSKKRNGSKHLSIAAAYHYLRCEIELLDTKRVASNKFC